MAQIRVRGHVPKRYVERTMKIRGFRPQLGRQKVEDGARFLRIVQTFIGRQTERPKDIQDLFRWYPAVREQMFAPDNFQTHEFAKHPVETHVERRGWGIEVCTRACKRFVDAWRKQASDLVHAFRTSSDRLEQSNIYLPIPTELVDCRKQRHPRQIGQLGQRVVLPVSQHSHPGADIVGCLEYVPPSFAVGQLEKSTVLMVLSKTKSLARAQNQQGEPVIYRVGFQAACNAVSPQPLRPSMLLAGSDHFAAHGGIVPPFQ